MVLKVATLLVNHTGISMTIHDGFFGSLKKKEDEMIHYHYIEQRYKESRSITCKLGNTRIKVACATSIKLLCARMHYQIVVCLGRTSF